MAGPRYTKKKLDVLTILKLNYKEQEWNQGEYVRVRRKTFGRRVVLSKQHWVNTNANAIEKQSPLSDLEAWRGAKRGLDEEQV